jgi:DNA-binding NtrC family response regulator
LGALPSELVASELFGHEKGAFTGANEQHIGIFERAISGTVLLDEIESIDDKVQVSLLRLIEQRKFNRLGGRKTIHSNARIIAASNEDLKDLVEKKLFRKDLYYRLDVFRIVMPPLRENLQDLPLLVQEFIARFNRTFNKRIQNISDETLGLLQAYEWPGNIRELKNVIQRAVLLCKEDEILPEFLPTRFLSKKTAKPSPSTPSSITFDIGTPLRQVERTIIVHTLKAAKNNRTEAAKLLGISRRALYNKLRTFNIG